MRLAIELSRDERRVLSNIVAGADYRTRRAWPAQRSRLQDLGLIDNNEKPTPCGVEVAEASA